MSTEKKLLIVNADDYGRTPEICNGILECAKAGLVRSTTVMSNHVRESDLESLLTSRLSAGLHFNLTSGKPIAPWDGQLLSEDGKFRRKPPEDLPVEFIEAELEAQWDYLALRGLHLTHIDSHHHIHAQAAVFAVVASFAIRRGVPVRSCDDAIRMRLKRLGIPTTERFNADFYGENHVTPKGILQILDLSDCASLEIMCHPGFNSTELKSESTYSGERELELSVLTDPFLIEAVNGRGWTPGSFGDLEE